MNIIPKKYIKAALIFCWASTLFCVSIAYAQRPLVVGISTDVSSLKERQKAGETIAAYLAKKLQKKIVVLLPQKNNELIQMLKDKKVDIAFLNTFGYILASAEVAIDPLVVVSADARQPAAYKSCLIKHPDTKVKTIPDVVKKSNAAQLRFAFVNPTSTSGHLVPRLYFNSLGLNYTESHFKEIIFGNNHTNTIRQIASHKADLGACSYDDLQKMMATGKISKKAVEVLWVSSPIVNGPIAVRTQLDKSLKTAIGQAFLKMPDNAPQLQAAFKKLWHTSGKKTYFVKAQNTWYDPIRKMASSLEELVLILNYYTD
ncbi:substrate-binding domain-containing protein [Microscilla marina]|uniref:Phosphonate ABC transporter, periplasmic phosphonate-binding protein n=1 Tax=Microscilla marina ATCC 23134 TaxID=313606 RepID=A1ZXJ7_MICM2|nr:phosphate/phosphite/phosphonate ABC transporter substrate-binding protein [Microscilla marina]EAY24872.1 phosphonate ABC transporter, periplasmic phosphonate-binding protein [Microscilla marina ATCC 23134]